MNKKFIPLYKPSLSLNEKRNVISCIEQGWISSKGAYVNKFENEFKKKFKYKYATVTSNGTTALHLALMSLGIKKGDEVIVPNITFVATANAVTYVGAKPIFVDIDSKTWLMDYDKILRKISKKTKAIILVHLYGFTYNFDEILKIKKKYKINIIEDCAESIGSKYKKQYCGSFGDVSTFSFYGNKTITTGEGGMVVCKKNSIYNKIVKLKSQGLNIKKINNFYNHEIIGYNYRMTNICASIGLSQLKKLDYFIKKKRKIFSLYQKFLNNNYVKFQEKINATESTYWLVTILLKNAKLKNSLQKHLLNNSIETRPIFTPMSKLKMYKQSNKEFKNSNKIYYSGISLPSFPDLSNNEIKKICKIINIYLLKKL